MIDIVIKGKHLSQITLDDLSLSELQTILVTHVKQKTNDLEERGYPFNGKVFNCSNQSRNDYESIYMRKDKIFALVPAFQIRTVQGELYTFTSAVQVEGWADTLFFTVFQNRQVEQAIINQIEAAQTLENIFAIEDNR